MAIMYPDAQKTRVIFQSKAEEQFYIKASLLSDHWVVYYSCTLSAIEGKSGLKENEIDFVLYHPNFGIVVVEIKGGLIGFQAETREFYSINRHGSRFSIKNPFQQAQVWKNRLVRHIREQNIRVPVSHGVCFPSMDEGIFPVSAEVEPELLIGLHALDDLENKLKSIVRKSHANKYLTFDDQKEEVDRFLRGCSFEAKFYFRDYIDSHEKKIKDVETIHETLVSPISGSRKLALEGEAGTGKTMLALMLAKGFRDQGLSVLLLTSNPLLNAFLRDEAGEGIALETYTDLASSFGVELLRRPENIEGTDEDWIQFIGPERFRQAIEHSSIRYDVLLCDEAQDVQPFWWEPIVILLSNDQDSRFYIFFDRSQGVFGSGSHDVSFVPEDVLPISAPYFTLVHNYRTTREIGSFARYFRTGTEIIQAHSDRLGYIPQIVTYADKADFNSQMDRLVRRLCDAEGLETKEITLLSARRAFHSGSILEGKKTINGTPIYEMSRRKTSKKNGIGISTISAFKGLETSIGIVINMSEYNLPLSNPIMSSLFYVACTRAKHMLYVFLKEGDAKIDIIKEALSGVDRTGSLVVNKSLSDYEFQGVVTHYNPERVGWLKVDDPTFEKSNIQFFPSDVAKSNLNDIRVGETISFRPKIEGLDTIACELKVAG